MVIIKFVDQDYKEIEQHCIDLTMEEVLRILPKLNYKIGKHSMYYKKTGNIIVDFKNRRIEIQLDCIHIDCIHI